MAATQPEAVLNLLTPRQRYCLVKVCVDGETEHQVGQWLGSSQQAVSRMISRARRVLARQGLGLPFAEYPKNRDAAGAGVGGFESRAVSGLGDGPSGSPAFTRPNHAPHAPTVAKMGRSVLCGKSTLPASTFDYLGRPGGPRNCGADSRAGAGSIPAPRI